MATAKKSNRTISQCAPTGFRDLGDEYQLAFVTFIDILGFKSLINNKDPREINSILDAMRLFSSQPQRRYPPFDRAESLPIVVQFSDSIIRIQPVVESDEEKYLLNFFYEELNSLVIYQGNMACNGVMIRGGLTLGKVCVHKDRIFGPGFVRAYQIESSLARYPRILIDEILCANSDDNPIINSMGYYMWSEMSAHIYEMLYRADDGQWCLDYLPYIYQAEHDPGISGLDVLRAHRDGIIAQLALVGASKSDEAIAKIRWVANYHNKIIERAFKRLNHQLEESGETLFVDLDQ